MKSLVLHLETSCNIYFPEKNYVIDRAVVLTKHSPPSCDEVKNGGAIPSSPHKSSWHGA
jgi:hypothetical protein